MGRRPTVHLANLRARRQAVFSGRLSWAIDDNIFATFEPAGEARIFEKPVASLCHMTLLILTARLLVFLA